MPFETVFSTIAKVALAVARARLPLARVSTLLSPRSPSGVARVGAPDQDGAGKLGDALRVGDARQRLGGVGPAVEVLDEHDGDRPFGGQLPDRFKRSADVLGLPGVHGAGEVGGDRVDRDQHGAPSSSAQIAASRGVEVGAGLDQTRSRSAPAASRRGRMVSSASSSAESMMTPPGVVLTPWPVVAAKRAGR